MSDLPDYHCPECSGIDCAHCYCLPPTECESCIEFAKKEAE